MTSQETFSTHRESLETAFSLFNQVSAELSVSYQQLQQQVLELSRELAAARNERMLQLAEKERLADRLRHLLETLPAAVIRLDPENRVKEFNPAASSLFVSIAVDEDWSRLLARHCPPGHSNGVELQLHNGKVLSISSSDLDHAAGSILVILDVTETHRLQERLNRQQRLSAMGEMSAQLAHQMRTPLSSALLYTSHLANIDLSDEQRRRFSQKLHSRLLHMERQISDILLFARGSSVGTQSFSLADLTSEFVADMSSEMCRAHASLRLEIKDGDETHLVGRADALRGVLANLTDNALHHGADEIKISLQGGARIRLLLADNGSGVPLENREQIFDPFFTTRSDGTGLGLAVVQDIVLSHQGEVSCSETRQGGALFTLEFPATGAPIIDSRARASQQQPHQPQSFQSRSLA